jgi:hypothetical protein
MAVNSVDEIALIQDELRGFSTLKSAVNFLHTLFPHVSPNWLSRHMDAIKRLSPDQFYRAFMHADSTGEHATNRARTKELRRTRKHQEAFTGQHATTVRGAIVRRHKRQYEGEIVSCTCGWERRWAVRNGSAAIEGRLHEHEMNL